MKKILLKILAVFLALLMLAVPVKHVYGEEDPGDTETTTEESMTEPDTESSTESDTEPTEATTESTEVPTEPEDTSPETTTEATPESPTEPPTEPPTETSPETEPETEPVTESETEPPTTTAPAPTENFVDESLGDYGPDIYAMSYCVLDGETGEVLLSCRKDERHYPASCTKVLTALLVLENVENLDETLTFTPSAINIDPSSSTLEPKAMVGETMTVRDALYGLILKSANECGAMLGEYVAGSEEAFAEMMNRRAQEIGCRNSHFMNAYGIHHPDHYTTAYDLALVLREALKNPAFRELNSTITYTIPTTNFNAPRTFTMGHQMLNGSYPVPEDVHVFGGKTGSTPQAGKCLTTAAEKNGYYTVSALMKSSADAYYPDEAVLLEYVYGLHEHTMTPVSWVPVHDHVTASDGVRIRYSPSQRGVVERPCYGAETFERLGIYGDWSKVLVNGNIRYIATELLQSDDPDHVPVTEPYVYVEPTTEEETEAPTETEESEEKQSSGAARVTTTAPSQGESESAETGSTNDPQKKTGGFRPIYVILPAAVIIGGAALWIILLREKRKRERERRRQMLERRRQREQQK
ncbi:MAG: D-alanyl-D-alanine carboxypeptidase [Lachnospiraceae bacterium]|nr:D-alanyl-D-alanine carboxypeptidase [Lachnospiraceae bacterium]